VAQKKSRNQSAKPTTPATGGRRRNLLWGGVAVAVIAVAAGLLYFSYTPSHPQIESGAGSIPLPGGEARDDVPVDAQYIGSSTCASCHDGEAAEWRKSQHHDAMAEASDKSMLGNFNGTKFTYAGTTSTFFKRDGKFFVTTDGRDGKLTDYEIIDSRINNGYGSNYGHGNSEA